MSTHKVVEGFPDVPRRFTRRVGDWVQEGGNNTLIIMGTDRANAGPASVDDGLGTIESPGEGKRSGVVHIVAGRHDPDGNPDFSADDAFIYIAQRTNADDNLLSSDIENGTANQPAIIAKSTDLRLVFGGPDGNGSIKVFFDDQEKQKYLSIDRGKAKVNFAEDAHLVLNDEMCDVVIGENQIIVKRDGTITVNSTKQVTVNTKTATVNADTEAIINGKTTINGETTVNGVMTVNTQMLTVNGPTKAGVITAGSISAGAGGTGGNGPSKFTGNVVVTQVVTAGSDVSGGGISLKKHTHKLAGSAKFGPDVSTTVTPT